MAPQRKLLRKHHAWHLQMVQRYQALSAGAEIVESQLKDALVEHLNAELTLGTIRDISQAVAWIQTTFLFVRVRGASSCPCEGAARLRDVAALSSRRCAGKQQAQHATDLLDAAHKPSCMCTLRLTGGPVVQMVRNPGYYGLQLHTSDPAAVKPAIRDKFINTALKQLAEHGLVRPTSHAHGCTQLLERSVAAGF